MATQWLQSHPSKTKTSQETQKNLMKFLEPTRKPKVIYTDNSLEFGKSCEELSWNHCTSTPHRQETNGIAERAARRVQEGTSAVLLQSGLDNSMVGGFDGMLLLSSEYSGSFIWWEDTQWKTVRNTFKRTSNTVWSNGRISPCFCEWPVEITSICSKCLARYILWICIARGWHLERRH